MNRVLQPDVHPDAESLNAFAERALPQPERAQIVAHLGGCARCREVVFLAQTAAEADAALVAAVKTESLPAKSGRTWWRPAFAYWRIALIPAAALASAAGLLIWLQTKSAPPAATVAQVSHPSPMLSAATPPIPPPAEAAEASAAASVAEHHARPKAARAERRNSPSETLSVTGSAASEQTPELPPPVPQVRLPDRFRADRNSSALAPKQSEINPGVMGIAAQPPTAPVPPNLTAVHGSLMTSATGGPRPLAVEAAPSSPMELTPQPINGLAALRLTTHPRLPSGLNAVSSAVMLDRILAVDPEGAVFLSHDAAKHWERVPVQWTGKAVSVEAPPRELFPLNAAAQKDAALHASPVASVSVMAAPPAPAPDAPPPAVQSQAAPPASSSPPAPGPPPPPPPAEAKAALVVPGMLFKLINDRHQTWVSVDGNVWRAQ